jgi:uncharacterized membrane protein YjfL (UPF0719 family)
MITTWQVAKAAVVLGAFIYTQVKKYKKNKPEEKK